MVFFSNNYSWNHMPNDVSIIRCWQEIIIAVMIAAKMKNDGQKKSIK